MLSRLPITAVCTYCLLALSCLLYRPTDAATSVVPKYFATVSAQTGVDANALYALALINCRHQVGNYWVAWPWTIYDSGKVIKLKSQAELIRYLQNDSDIAFGLFALTLRDFDKHHMDVTNLAVITRPETQLRLVSTHFDASNSQWLNQVAVQFGLGDTGHTGTTSIATESVISIPPHVKGLERIIYRSAKKYNVPVYLVKAVIRAESAFNPKAVSHAGAMGLMQVMPGTAKTLGVSNPKLLFNPEVAVDTGTRYLAMQLRDFNSIPLALAAYNAGPGAVRKYGYQVPPYRETRHYVKIVQRYMRHYQRLGGV